MSAPIPITFHGKTQSIAAWAREYGLDYGRLQRRLKSGWTFEEAIVTKVLHQGEPCINRAEWVAWMQMKQRCFQKNVKNYCNYGGRGIRVCQRWLGRDGFLNFLEDVGNRPSDDYSIDRINNSGHYSCGKCPECLENHWPANCRWATLKEQARNRRSNRLLTFNGITKTMVEWSEETGIPYCTLKRRLGKYGWSVEKALSLGVQYTRQLVFNGESHTMQEWANITGLSYGTIKLRLRRGWSLEDTLTLPYKSKL